MPRSGTEVPAPPSAQTWGARPDLGGGGELPSPPGSLPHSPRHALYPSPGMWANRLQPQDGSRSRAPEPALQGSGGPRL